MQGIQLGDILVKVATSAVSDYDEVMKILPFCPYPLTLVFRRGKNKKESLFSGEAVLRNSTVSLLYITCVNILILGISLVLLSLLL
jgi:hypothetical protein